MRKEILWRKKFFLHVLFTKEEIYVKNEGVREVYNIYLEVCMYVLVIVTDIISVTLQKKNETHTTEGV